jgi:hypothetical protein
MYAFANQQTGQWLIQATNAQQMRKGTKLKGMNAKDL